MQGASYPVLHQAVCCPFGVLTYDDPVKYNGIIDVHFVGNTLCVSLSGGREISVAIDQVDIKSDLVNSFFSSDKGEPPHIHVKQDRQIAKFWLDPISLAKNQGFQKHELTRIIYLVVKHQPTLLEAWHDYFGS
jgi:hypothetical protein